MTHGTQNNPLETTDGSPVDTEITTRGLTGLVVKTIDDGEVKELLFEILTVLEQIRDSR